MNLWKQKVLERDGWQCQKCGRTRSSIRRNPGYKGFFTRGNDGTWRTGELITFDKEVGWNEEQSIIHGRKRIKLHVHHKKPVRMILEMQRIETLSQALNCRQLWDTRNGITLCENCHRTAEFKVRRLESKINTTNAEYHQHDI